jgi:WD40 repeat protein
MQITDRDKCYLPILLIVALAISLLIFYPGSQQPDQEPLPPATGEVREVPFSWTDRAISTWYEMITREPIVAIIRQDIPAQIGAISPDGRYVATGGTIISNVRISSIAEKRIVRQFAIDYGIVVAVAFSPDGRYLATGRGFMSRASHNESINIWEVESGKLIRNLPGPAGPGMTENNVDTLAFSADNRLLAVGYHTQPKGDSVHLFDATTGERVRILHPSRAVRGQLTFFNDDKYLGFFEIGGNYNVHDVSTGERVLQYSQQGAYAVSPDGKYLAAGLNSEEKLKILDLWTGKTVKVLDSSRRPYEIIAYSPDGRYIAVSGDEGLRLWDVSSGKMVRELKGNPDILGYGIGFDAEGRYFAAVCGKYVVVWDFRKLVQAGRVN